MDKVIPLATAVVGDAFGGIVLNPGTNSNCCDIKANLLSAKGEKVESRKAPSWSERWAYIKRNIPRCGKQFDVLVGNPVDVSGI